MHRLWQFLAWVIGSDGGLIRTGNWCVVYPDGKRSRSLDLGYCGVLRAIFGGRIKYAKYNPPHRLTIGESE